MIKTLSELNLPLPDKLEGLWRYARLIAEDVVNGSAEPSEAVEDLYWISSELDHDSRMHAWVVLDDTLEYIRTGQEAYAFAASATKEEFDALAKEEAKRFLNETSETFDTTS